MIRPKDVKSDSKSVCVIFFGSPDTYKLAPFIDSELGRAKETCINLNKIINKIYK